MRILAFSTAMLGGLFFIAVAQAQPVETHHESGCGFSVYSTTTIDTVPLADGHKLMNVHTWGLFYTEDPESRLNESRYDCFGSHPFDAAGENLGGQGYCAGIAKDGETDRAVKRSMAMIVWHNDDPREQVLYAQRDIGNLSTIL
jgi:hypothetical protein